MRQISKNRKPIKKAKNVIPKTKTVRKIARWHPKYGTSKLEDDFANDFLDKLKVKYSRQFEAKDIGRFYDFCVFVNGVQDDFSIGNLLLIEIDGSYFHSDPRLVKEEDMSPMQKRNKKVDEHKDKWALMHGIPIIRIWEKDIRENPKQVLSDLKKRLHIEEEKRILVEKKNKRHVNKIK